MKRPHPVDFLDLESFDIDQLAFQVAYNDYEKYLQNIPKEKQRKFSQRKSYPRKDPKTSQWYTDYVLDSSRDAWLPLFC